MRKQFFLLLLVSSLAEANCNPSFMVCPNEDGSFHFLNQRPSVQFQSRGESTNRTLTQSPVVPKQKARAERVKTAKEYLQQCLPDEYWPIMSKIIAHESGANQFAINVNGGKYKLDKQPETKDSAVRVAKMLIEQGFNIDMGYAQINSQHLQPKGFLSKYGVSVEDIFDPCVNLRAGANIYGSAHVRNGGNVGLALSVYNTGTTTKGLSNGYVKNVLASDL
jgi:type IV secretion system protein VirB1